jgi:molybdate transport system regulatory protein
MILLTIGDKKSKRRHSMQISARNQFEGRVKEVVLGNVMAEVVVDVGGQEVAAAITRRSAEALGLKAGDTVTAIIKATEVMIGK